MSGNSSHVRLPSHGVIARSLVSVDDGLNKEGGPRLVLT